MLYKYNSFLLLLLNFAFFTFSENRTAIMLITITIILIFIAFFCFTPVGICTLLTSPFASMSWEFVWFVVEHDLHSSAVVAAIVVSVALNAIIFLKFWDMITVFPCDKNGIPAPHASSDFMTKRKSKYTVLFKCIS